jgi:Uma2 family endonuclease
MSAETAMLDAKSHTPYLRWTPRRVKLDDGREVDVPDTMTVPEFERFPWPEGQRWELLWGSPVLTPSPMFSHQDLLGELLVLLRQSLSASGLRVVPGVDVRLPMADSYVCPDIAVIAPGEAQSLASLPLIVVPRLVVELLSPSTRGNDLGVKLDAYAAAGIPEYWVANPQTGALSIYENPEAGYAESRPDSEGFTRSPLLDLAVKIVRDGDVSRVETRQA